MANIKAYLSGNLTLGRAGKSLCLEMHLPIFHDMIVYWSVINDFWGDVHCLGRSIVSSLTHISNCKTCGNLGARNLYAVRGQKDVETSLSLCRRDLVC